MRAIADRGRPDKADDRAFNMEPTYPCFGRK